MKLSDGSVLTDEKEALQREQSLQREHHQRIQHLRAACSNNNLFQNITYRNKPSYPTYYVSEEYNFTYCIVPKAGSTFWSQVFNILKAGSGVAQSVLGKFRKFIIKDKIRQTLSRISSKKTHGLDSVLVARDPYSRLFSAFVDRLFLPSGDYREGISFARKLRNNTTSKHNCANDLTFEDFLRSVSESARENKTLNRHWTPIYSLCSPCDVNAIAVVKMESFSTDVKFILKNVGISKDKLDAIFEGLGHRRIDLTIHGLVPAIMSSKDYDCMNKTEIARRIWVSLQIQGFLDDKVDFPFDIVNSEEKAANRTFLTDLIVKTIKEHPMTSKESNVQKRRALVHAFAGVSENIIKEIRNLFKQDFALFQYSENPPL